MSLIKGYPQDADITIMNDMYLYPRKNEETGKWDNGSITLVYKDNITGQKGHVTIDDPDFEFYIAKPEYVKFDDEGKPVQELYKPENELDKIKCKFKDREKIMAELTGNEEFFYENIKRGCRKENRRLHGLGLFYAADSDIGDFYRRQFDLQYANNAGNVSKAFFDIEADTIHMKGDFPEMGECPINAVTIIDEQHSQVFTLLLRNSKNPLIEQFEKSVDQHLFNELRDFIINQVGGQKRAEKFGIDKLNYNFIFYNEDEEIRLIQDLFIYINQSQPDFVLAWNMAFDIPYIIARIRRLGYDPAEIMCHPDFEHKIAEYRIDERNLNEFAERGDMALISSYSVYLDQMIQFASRRKGQGEFTTFNLDFIGELVAEVNKVSYSHITTDIARFPYLDYKLFVFYNIIDTIVQKCVEGTVNDIDYVFGKCVMNNTRYSKCHRQTVYLKNRGFKEFFNDFGMIIGNNTNVFKPKPEDKYPGAFVGDPLLLDDYAKRRINNIPIMVFDNLDDFDFRALYPSIIREFNMAPNTMIGMVNIPEQIHEDENPREDPKYSRGGAFLNDFQSQNFLLFCHRWLKFGSYMELYNDVKEYYSQVKVPFIPLRLFTHEGLIIPANIYNKDALIIPARIVDKNNLIRPAVMYKKLDITKYKGEIYQ